MATKTEDPEAKDGEKEAKGGGKMKIILMVLPTLLLVGALAYFLFLKPSGTAEAVPAEEVPPEPGIVVVLEPVTINLAGGHYLKLGMTLQATAAVAEAVDGSKALDAAIELYSGMAIDEISSADGREQTKGELIEKVKEKYEDEIYDIYFTTFVYQ